MKEEGFEPGQYTTICSEHFEEDCFIETKFRWELKPNPIPTIFKTETDQKKRKRSQDAVLDHEETMKKICQEHSYTLPSPKELKARNTKLIEKNKALKKTEVCKKNGRKRKEKMQKSPRSPWRLAKQSLDFKQCWRGPSKNNI